MSLLRTAARTAVITSTATRAHGRAAARQQGRWAAQHEPPPAAPPPSPPVAAPPNPVSAPPPAAGGADTDRMIEQLTKLGDLRSAGVLTQEEFEAQKARILQQT